jgi:hypothetical protein
MTDSPEQKTRKIENPASHYATPQDIIKDPHLSDEEKKKALNTWEQDARQLVTASNEGMPGSDEGLDKEDHHQLGQVVRAKEAIGEKPKHKPSQ